MPVESQIKNGKQRKFINKNKFDKIETPVKDYMKFVKICMKVMAMLPVFKPGQSLLYDAINLSYILMVNFISIYIFAFSTADLIFNWDGNLFKATFNLINTVIYATNTTLLIYFQYNNEKLENLIDTLNTTFKYKSADGLTCLNMQGSFERARLYSKIFTSACLCGALHWAVEPFFIDDGTRPLPLKIWYPVDVQLTPYYEIAYTTQFFGQIMVAIVFSNFGIFFMSECILICGQFDILCCSLRNLIFTALLNRNFPVDKLVKICGYDYQGSNRCTLPEDELNVYFSGRAKIMDPKLQAILDNQNLDSSAEKNCDVKYEYKLPVMLFDKGVFKYDMEVIEAIKKCVLHHQSLLNYCQQLEAFFSPMSLVKMMEITVLVCFIMYAFSVSFEIPVLEYGALTCIDLFLLCYFGNEVMLRSRNVSTAVCDGPWQLLGTRALRTLLPLLIRSSRPVCFTGGKFYTLTLENYLAVLKVSFSYFTVLRNVNEAQSKK